MKKLILITDIVGIWILKNKKANIVIKSLNQLPETLRKINPY